jgi:hypothetical protein
MWSSEQTRAHIEAVGERIAASAPDDLRELLLLVAAGAGQLTDTVVAVALGFGEVWALTDDAAIDGYIERHAAHLRALLLFELAHEGDTTETMTAVAHRAGIAEEFADWQAPM